MSHFKIKAHLVAVKEIYYLKVFSLELCGLFFLLIKFLNTYHPTTLYCCLCNICFSLQYIKDKWLCPWLTYYIYCSIKKYMLAVGFHSVFFLRYFLFDFFKVVQAYLI